MATSRMNYLFLLLLLFGSTAYAEALKPFIPAEPDLKGFWWPILTDASKTPQQRIYGLPLGPYPSAHDGTLLNSVETIIYARALFKPRLRGVSSIEDLIEDEHAHFRETNPDTLIKKAEPIRSLNGTPLVSYTYISKKGGAWERVTYSEEGDYYLLFTIRSQNQHRYQSDQESYLTYIHQYQKRLNLSARQISNHREMLMQQGERSGEQSDTTAELE